MMNTIINEKGITFNQLEKEIFNYICRFGRELAKGVLEKYDNYLMESRDKSAYRHKGLREISTLHYFTPKSPLASIRMSRGYLF